MAVIAKPKYEAVAISSHTGKLKKKEYRLLTDCRSRKLLRFRACENSEGHDRFKSEKPVRVQGTCS